VIAIYVSLAGFLSADYSIFFTNTSRENFWTPRKNTSNQNNTIYISFKKYQTQTRNLICSLIDYQLTQTESFFKFPAIIF